MFAQFTIFLFAVLEPLHQARTQKNKKNSCTGYCCCCTQHPMSRACTLYRITTADWIEERKVEMLLIHECIVTHCFAVTGQQQHLLLFAITTTTTTFLSAYFPKS